MKQIPIKIFIAIICILSVISCGSNSKNTEKENLSDASYDSSITNAEKKKICGTWEVSTGIIYDKKDFKVLYPEEPFDENLKWKLIITEDGKITKPAEDEYSEADEATYELYTGSEALEKGIIDKKHQRRAASSNGDFILLVTDKQIIDERLIQIVNCTEDTLTIRFLSSGKLFSNYLFEYKLVKIQ